MNSIQTEREVVTNGTIDVSLMPNAEFGLLVESLLALIGQDNIKEQNG